jgi:O-antigen/teichoic acid export membrane protein
MSFDQVIIQRKLFAWAMKGGLTIVDQGLITGSNFVIGVLLARWLPPDQYGTYAVAWAIFLLFAMLHQSLLQEPQMVFGASAYRHCARSYLKVLLRLHLATSLLISFALCASAEVALKLGQRGSLPGALAALAIAAPLVLLFWIVRRSFYLQFSPAPAVAGGLLYSAFAIGGLYVVRRLRLLSPMFALLSMGLGALAASIFFFTYLKLRLPSSLAAPNLRETWDRHWRYGRWALASAAVMWIPANFFYPLLSSFSGMAQAGELKALMNFAAPILQTCAALAVLLLPYVTRTHEHKGYAGTGTITRHITLLCISGTVMYWLPLLLFKAPAFRLLYSGRYTDVAYLLPVVALGSVFFSAFFASANALRATESPASVFAAVLVSTCVSLTIGVPAVRVFGVKGAVWSTTLSEILAFVIAMLLLRRKVRKALQEATSFPELSVSD